MENVYIHPTAVVSEEAKIGEGTKIWVGVQVRENSEIGQNCVLSKNVYVDCNVKIGKNVKIQNNVSVYHGVTIEDGAFIGPHVCFTNDKLPRSINPDGSLKSDDDWLEGKTLVKKGASIGANSVILPNDLILGEFCLVGSGSVVTKHVPDYGIVIGNPAKLVGFVCACGYKLEKVDVNDNGVMMKCTKCDLTYTIPIKDYEAIKR